MGKMMAGGGGGDDSEGGAGQVIQQMMGGVTDYFKQKEQMANSGHPAQIDVTQTPQLPASFFQAPQFSGQQKQEQIDPVTGLPINPMSSMFMGGR